MGNEQVIINKTVNESSDSLEIGTPSKGGAIKCYFDFNKPDECKQKLSNAVSVRNYANSLM